MMRMLLQSSASSRLPSKLARRKGYCLAGLLGFLAVFGMALLGCGVTSPSRLDRLTLKPDDVNIYIRNHRINLYRSTIKDVQNAMGRPGAVTPLSNADSESIDRIDLIQSFSIDFFRRTGQIIRMTINGPEATVGGGIGVGSSRQQAQAFLLNGIANQEQLD
jgi:hypothetical protein